MQSVKVGDKVRRKPQHIGDGWRERCVRKNADPNGIFTVSYVSRDFVGDGEFDLTFKEVGSVWFGPYFDVVERLDGLSIIEKLEEEV